jgi:hypothetical protein
MTFNSGSRLALLVFACLVGTTDLVVLGQEAAPTSFKFNQPIPVVIRKSNNSIANMMLLGINENGITVMSAAGKTFEYANNTFRNLKSADGSFTYSPTKDNASEVIQRLNQLQPANANPAGQGPGGAPVPGGTPFTFTNPGAHAQPAAHAQPPNTFPPSTFPPTAPGFGQPNSGANPTAAAAHAQAMMAHAQSATAPGAVPPTNTFTPPAHAGPHNAHSNAHSQTPFTTPASTPGMHSQSPSGMPGMPAHNQMPPTAPGMMPGMNPGMAPGMNPGMNPGAGANSQSLMMYQCSKCKYQFTSAVEIKAGHKCAQCGTIWGEVRDENGRVTSTSPAAKVGGAVGLIVTVIGIIAAIVRKSRSA